MKQKKTNLKMNNNVSLAKMHKFSVCRIFADYPEVGF